jgi:hypothetical protein
MGNMPEMLVDPNGLMAGFDRANPIGGSNEVGGTGGGGANVGGSNGHLYSISGIDLDPNNLFDSKGAFNALVVRVDAFHKWNSVLATINCTLDANGNIKGNSYNVFHDKKGASGGNLDGVSYESIARNDGFNPDPQDKNGVPQESDNTNMGDYDMYAPLHVDNFDGSWGWLRHFLTGGIVGNGRYDGDGNLIGVAPIMGNPPIPSFSGGKVIQFGKLVVDATKFHRFIKPNILKAAGKISNFTKVVGKNPDIVIEKGKILLRGTGPFKNKIFPTGLDVTDFF